MIDAARRSGISRVVVLPAFGVGVSRAKASAVMRFLLTGGKHT